MSPPHATRCFSRVSALVLVGMVALGCADQIKVEVVSDLGETPWAFALWVNADAPSGAPDALWDWPVGKTRSNFVLRGVSSADVFAEARSREGTGDGEVGNQVLSRTRAFVRDGSVLYLFQGCDACAEGALCQSDGSCLLVPDAGEDGAVDAGDADVSDAGDAGISPVDGAADAPADAREEAGSELGPCLIEVCEGGRCDVQPLDKDEDGYAPASEGLTCDPSSGLMPGDCDDTDERAYPGSFFYAEVPTNSGGFDYNCDGLEEPIFTIHPMDTSLCEDLSAGFQCESFAAYRPWEYPARCGAEAVFAGCRNDGSTLCEESIGQYVRIQCR